MYFIPGTPVYDTHKDDLLEQGNWSRCTGKVVHRLKNISPVDLQKEIITASRTIYSFKRLLSAIIKKRGTERVLFAGEYFWQQSVLRELRGDIKCIKKLSEASPLHCV